MWRQQCIEVAMALLALPAQVLENLELAGGAGWAVCTGASCRQASSVPGHRRWLQLQGAHTAVVPSAGRCYGVLMAD
jgi:hypothetical protein